MGANIKHLNLHQTYHEDETGRQSCNFVKGHEFGSKHFNSGDYGIYYCGGFVPEHVHDQVEEVFYIVRGKGTAIINGEERPVKAGDILVVAPGTTHGLRNTGDDVLEHIVCSAKLGG